MMLFLFLQGTLHAESLHKKEQLDYSALGCGLALCCLFSVIVRSTLQQVRNTWDVLGESLKFGIEAVCLGPLRRLRPNTEDNCLIEPVCER